MDFTIKTHTEFLKSLIKLNFNFQTFHEFITTPNSNSIILRHDVDKLPENSLLFAKLQEKMGIKASYYFRAIPKSWNEDIIKEIANLDHEIGYHYENMDICNGDIDKAWDDFRYNLDKLRKLVDVKTICMHGSPLSKFDNKNLWTKYDYYSLGIIGEPYFDVNFDETLYLTDTGRRWDGWRTSVRDKVFQQDKWTKQGLIFHSTSDIIKAIESNNLPKKILFTFHPQRWTDNNFIWIRNYLLQKIKNPIKQLVIKRKQ